MKLLKKIVNAFSASRTDLHDSIERLAGPTKRRKTIDNDEIPHQMIEAPTGASILQLNKQQYDQVRKLSGRQLEPILKKCLRMSKKEAARTVSQLLNYTEPQTNSESIFGCPINLIPSEMMNQDTQLPVVIVKLMHSFVSRGGFEQEGPFRIEGDKQQLNDLVMGISKGFEAEGTEIDSFPIAVLAAAIKRYLRCIPGSLIPQETTAVLVKLFNLKDNLLRSVAIHLTLLTLPFQHAKIFASVNLLLKTCSMRESVHKMSAAALTVCFGPTLFDTGIDLNLVSGVNSLLNELIENYSIYSIVPSIIN